MILKQVLQLRELRPKMVQSLQQYTFLYQVAIDSFQHLHCGCHWSLEMRIPSNLLSNVTTIILSPTFLQNLLPSDNGHVHQDAPKWAKLSGQGDFNLLGFGNPDGDGDRDARRMLVMIYDICKWRLFTNECIVTDGDNM